MTQVYTSSVSQDSDVKLWTMTSSSPPIYVRRAKESPFLNFLIFSDRGKRCSDFPNCAEMGVFLVGEMGLLKWAPIFAAIEVVLTEISFMSWMSHELLGTNDRWDIVPELHMLHHAFREGKFVSELVHNLALIECRGLSRGEVIRGLKTGD